MSQNISKSTKIILHSTAVAAGTSTITPSSGVDCKGFMSCRFIVCMGAIVSGAATSIEAHQSSDDGSADSYTAILGSKVTIADDGDDTIYYLDVVQPRERYLKCIVNRATQNATVNAIVAELYDPTVEPITEDSSVSDGELHVAAAEGTA